MEHHKLPHFVLQHFMAFVVILYFPVFKFKTDDPAQAIQLSLLSDQVSPASCVGPALSPAGGVDGWSVSALNPLIPCCLGHIWPWL